MDLVVRKDEREMRTQFVLTLSDREISEAWLDSGLVRVCMDEANKFGNTSAALTSLSTIALHIESKKANPLRG